MKVLAINGSPRKTKNTAQVLESVLAGAAEAGAQTELVHLVGLNFSGCRSCFACKRLGGASYGRCAQKDDLTPVLEKAGEADVLVVGSPFYFSVETAETRAFEERLWFASYRYNLKDRTLAAPKKACALVYTMNVREEDVPKMKVKSALLELNRANMETVFSCPCSVFLCCDTLQFDDYSKYDNALFDPAHKLEHHRTVFPQDLERARALGRGLVQGR